MAHDTTKLVSAFQSSGLTQKAFCADRGIAVSALQYHLSKTRKSTPAANNDCTNRASGHFVPVHVEQTQGTERTVIIIHGEIGAEEITHLLRSVVG